MTFGIWDYIVSALIGLVVAFAIFVIFIAIPDAAKSYKGLYERCIADGKKDYECYSLIYGGGRR